MTDQPNRPNQAQRERVRKQRNFMFLLIGGATLLVFGLLWLHQNFDLPLMVIGGVLVALASTNLARKLAKTGYARAALGNGLTAVGGLYMIVVGLLDLTGTVEMELTVFHAIAALLPGQLIACTDPRFQMNRRRRG